MIKKMNKEQAKETIKQLTDKFSLQMDYYKSGNYNETQTRIDFPDPFFAALGWEDENANLKFILAVMNSKVVQYY